MTLSRPFCSCVLFCFCFCFFLPLDLGEADEDEEGSPRTVRTAEAKSVRPANMPLVEIKGVKACLSAEASAARCSSRGRGGVYDSVYGICCHFCRLLLPQSFCFGLSSVV